MKKVLAFDLDDTLSITKSPMSDRMATVFGSLLDYYDLCVISGGRFEQFKLQVTDVLHVSPKELVRLHLMPTCGTRYYRFDLLSDDWKLQYAEDLTDDEKTRIKKVLESSARELGLWPEHPTGIVIEDRDSQMTFSALGQQATPEDKYAWDPDGSKKLAIRNLAAPQLPDLAVNSGGTTSVDVTKIGIDKSYGMIKLIDTLGITKDDILYFGDKTEPGENDYPVKAMGIETITVLDQEDTVVRLEQILHEARA